MHEIKPMVNIPKTSVVENRRGGYGAINATNHTDGADNIGLTVRRGGMQGPKML